MHENVHAKGRRLLVEGRLIVKSVTDRSVYAVIRGDSAEIYTLSACENGYTCSCPAVVDARMSSRFSSAL